MIQQIIFRQGVKLMTKYHFEKVETWDAMTERHKQERINQVMFFSKSHTQTEAAEILGVTHRHLNNFVQRKGLNWRHKYKRAKKNCSFMTEDEYFSALKETIREISPIKRKRRFRMTRKSKSND